MPSLSLFFFRSYFSPAEFRFFVLFTFGGFLFRDFYFRDAFPGPRTGSSTAFLCSGWGSIIHEYSEILPTSYVPHHSQHDADF